LYPPVQILWVEETMPESQFVAETGKEGRGKTITQAQTCFERWLVRKKYRPIREVCSPADVKNGDCQGSRPAAELIYNYLADQPGQAKSEGELFEHADAIGDVTNKW
jgi:hypothetical protein